MIRKLLIIENKYNCLPCVSIPEALTNIVYNEFGNEKIKCVCAYQNDFKFSTDAIITHTSRKIDKMWYTISDYKYDDKVGSFMTFGFTYLQDIIYFIYEVDEDKKIYYKCEEPCNDIKSIIKCNGSCKEAISMYCDKCIDLHDKIKKSRLDRISKSILKHGTYGAYHDTPSIKQLEEMMEEVKRLEKSDPGRLKGFVPVPDYPNRLLPQSDTYDGKNFEEIYGELKNIADECKVEVKYISSHNDSILNERYAEYRVNPEFYGKLTIVGNDEINDDSVVWIDNELLYNAKNKKDK